MSMGGWGPSERCALIFGLGILFVWESKLVKVDEQSLKSAKTKAHFFV